MAGHYITRNIWNIEVHSERYDMHKDMFPKH